MPRVHDKFLREFFYKPIRRFNIYSQSNSVKIQHDCLLWLVVLILMRRKNIDANRYEVETKLHQITSKLSVTARRNYHISRLF